MSKLKKITIRIKDQLFPVKAEELKGQIWFHWNGKIFILNQTPPPLTGPLGHKTTHINDKNSDKHIILSPMPGQIVKIPVHPGQEVKENQTVLILSSMKMEYTLKASYKGVIKSVKVKEGEKVSADQELVEMTKSSET